MNYLENLIDSEGDSAKSLKIKKDNTVQPQQSLFTNKFNAMTLFAYRGDGDQDNFASAFSNSRVGPGNKLDSHYTGQKSAQKPNNGEKVDPIPSLDNNSIWMIPFQQPASEAKAAISDSNSSYSQNHSQADQRVIDLDRQFAQISNKSIKSARSGNSDSSNGSSLEKEIFGSIPNNFADQTETGNSGFQRKASGSNSTIDSSDNQNQA